MLVLPVIDLKSGVVVRGIAGERDQYRPIQSRIANEPTPQAIAHGFRQLGFGQAYIADLDAISGSEPDLDSYAAIVAAGLTPWIDAGVGTRDRTQKLVMQTSNLGDIRYIFGLESLTSVDELTGMRNVCSVDRLVFSLDLKAGRPLTSIDSWQAWSPQRIASAVIEHGIDQLIVLDLADVGVGRGTGTLAILESIKREHPHVRLIAGGGVRDANDLRRLEDAGCYAALVASALHDGRLSAADLGPYLG